MSNLDVWENIFQNNEWGKYPPVALIKFIAKNFYHVKKRKNIKILEIGSGPGANLWYMAREGFTVYGIDGSKTACEKGSARLASENLDGMVGEIITGDYYDVLNNFEDNYFDAVIDVESLYCNSFDKSQEIIKLLLTKLKPGGVMFSLTFADGTWGLDGENIGYHAVNPVDGPMANMGYGRYVTREDIDKLYGVDNIITNIERQELHLSDNKVIKEWIIETKKKS